MNDALDKELLEQAQNYIERWQCTPAGEAFMTHSSLLWPLQRNGVAVMLKIVKTDSDERHAANILELYNGHGAVHLYEKDSNAFLLEHITTTQNQPTLTQMVEQGADDKATEIICAVIAQLHHVSPDKNMPTLIPFEHRFHETRQYVAEGRLNDKDLPLFNKALKINDKLIKQTADTQMILHGDIHHENILYSENRDWLAIDPKGIYGPRAYEYANMICNPHELTNIVSHPERMGKQIQIISNMANIDPRILLEFAFVHAVQCLAWSLYDSEQSYWRAIAQCADKMMD